MHAHHIKIRLAPSFPRKKGRRPGKIELRSEAVDLDLQSSSSSFGASRREWQVLRGNAFLLPPPWPTVQSYDEAHCMREYFGGMELNSELLLSNTALDTVT